MVRMVHLALVTMAITLTVIGGMSPRGNSAVSHDTFRPFRQPDEETPE